MTDYTKVSLTMRNCTMSLDGYERLHAVEKRVNIKPHDSITDQSWDGGRMSVTSFTVSVIMECMFIILTGEINWLRTSTSSLHNMSRGQLVHMAIKTRSIAETNRLIPCQKPACPITYQ